MCSPIAMGLSLRKFSTLSVLLILGIVRTTLAAAILPGKIYGVNIGSWLVQEPWMLTTEWLGMGGEWCDDCSTCIASEFAFAKAYPDTVDEIFDKHWSSWFTQADVDRIASYGLNTVRIPLGYWIVEPLVDRKTEFFPRGGIKQLKRGLRQLKNAGIKAILDHHALPGVQTSNAAFTGRCTRDVEFFTEYNYHRALVWTAVMTALSHLDPDFGSVFAIEAVNEPTSDASQTPGYGGFQKNFVKVVRAVETLLGVDVLDKRIPDELPDGSLSQTLNVTESLLSGKSYEGEVGRALVDASPILAWIAVEMGAGSILGLGVAPSRTPLVTILNDISWQFNNPPNPADAARGPQAYDGHVYYASADMANFTEDDYLTSICNLQLVQEDAAVGNSPLIIGEWSLRTAVLMPQPSDAFLRKWADAQKRAYSVGGGWIFWNFKMEPPVDPDFDISRTWSYFQGIDNGYMTKDPSKLFDEHVCDAYIST